MGGKTHPGVGARGTRGGSVNSERFLLLESSSATEGEEGYIAQNTQIHSLKHTHARARARTQTLTMKLGEGAGSLFIMGACSQI